MTKMKGPPVGICIHHSLTKDGLLSDFEAIRRYHIVENGWDDIGYHGVAEFACGAYQVRQGRQYDMEGAHCPSINATHLGLCIVGDFDKAAPVWPLLDVAIDWCRERMREFSIEVKDVVFHNAYPPFKSCPGKLFPEQGFLLRLAGEVRP